MRLVVRHTHDFGSARDQVGAELLCPEAWDAARTVPGPFHLPETRVEWERLADRADLRARAADIVRVAGGLGASTLCSHGVGTGLLELDVHRADQSLELTCTDFAPRAAARLAALFPEARVVVCDLLADDLPSADLHVMHRLDAELSRDEWKSVFARLPQRILFVPNVLLDLATVAREVVRRLRPGRVTFAGWLRSEDALRELWHATHSDTRLAIGDEVGFLLEPRAQPPTFARVAQT